MQRDVYLSLGSNVGDRENNLREAVARLESAGPVVPVSACSNSEPVEMINQSWFLNCAVEIETMKMPKQLMAGVLEIEREMGRERTQRKRPRLFYINIIFFLVTLV